MPLKSARKERRGLRVPSLTWLLLRLRDVHFAIQDSTAISAISDKTSCKAPFAGALAPLLLACAVTAAQRGEGGAPTPTLPNYDAWGNMEVEADFEPLDPEEGWTRSI